MAQAQQQQPQGDHSMAPAWIMALLFVTAYIIWIKAHQYIVSLVFYLNIIQGKLVNLFLHNDDLSSKIYLMETIDPRAVDWNLLLDLTYYIGTYTRYPIITTLVIFCVLLYRSDVTTKYRRVHDMKSLSVQEQKNWPAIMPTIKEDLVSMDISTGPWAMSLSPMEFGRKYNLLKKNDLLLDDAVPGQELTASLRRGDAKRVFTLQLGPAFDGFERCPLHVQALAAAFMARMNRDKAAANEILTSMDKSYNTGKLQADTALKVLRQHQNTELVQDIFARHAYLLTVMAGLLEAARLDGVVPSAEFLWLKPTDRRLWYMLNCVGRQTPYVEIAGPFAHWKAEKAMGRPSRAPMIDEAIKALESAIKEVKLSSKEVRELEP